MKNPFEQGDYIKNKTHGVKIHDEFVKKDKSNSRKRHNEKHYVDINNLPSFMCKNELMFLFDISRSTLNNWIKQGKLPEPDRIISQKVKRYSKKIVLEYLYKIKNKVK